MKRNITFFAFVLFISFASCSFMTKKFDGDPEKDQLLLEVVQYVLANGHYNPKYIDNDFSEKVYTEYIDLMDSQKRYFLQSDIDEFSKYKTEIDDQLRNKSLAFFDLVYNRLLERMKNANKISQDILSKSFNFSTDETVNLDYDNLPYAKNENELKDRWRRMLKFSVMSNYLTKEKEEQKKKEKDKDYTVKSNEELEKEARESSSKALKELFNSYKDLTREDWFGMYVNTIAETFDPHTNYMAPDIKERFDTSMSGKFDGIGAQLQKKTDGILITSIILGGPVWKGKLLEVGDHILKVAQGDEEPVDVVGMRLDDAVKLIKGPKGTEVRLTVKRVDGTIEIVPIIRDVVELAETFAKSAIIEENKHKYGIINLPKFYINFEDYKERNAASDVALEIEKLKKQNIQGLILDLRDNGGGSLRTVVDIAGLFIKKGPIVQVQTSGGNKEVLKDTDNNIQWDGPLVILVNELSASASEILAAAMQDYERAIIIGGRQTYGKGTVQNIYDLNKLVRNGSSDLGALKLTIQKFYRINGGSTQLKGVKSDIAIPDKYKYIDIGERDMKNALEWDKIPAVPFEKWKNTPNFQRALENSKRRISENKQFSLLDENARWIKEQQDTNIYPLNYNIYKKQVEEKEEQSKKFKELSDYTSKLKIKSLPSEEAKVKDNEDLKLRRDRWHESLQKDIYIEESVYVLDDLTGDKKLIGSTP